MTASHALSQLSYSPTGDVFQFKTFASGPREFQLITLCWYRFTQPVSCDLPPPLRSKSSERIFGVISVLAGNLGCPLRINNPPGTGPESRKIPSFRLDFQAKWSVHVDAQTGVSGHGQMEEMRGGAVNPPQITDQEDSR